MAVGTAIYPFEGTDAEVLLAEADRRMYSAKPQGSRRAAPAIIEAKPVDPALEERVS
jgi:GGDEF domain-containing protein